jgi:flagellar biosynthetic protein FliQ
MVMMTPETVLTITQQALEITVLVSAPLLGAALVTGLVVSLFQAATQINEMTLSFIPKLLVLVLVMVLAGPWMMNTMLDYMRRLFSSIPMLIG